jgi:hypothetical protein
MSTKIEVRIISDGEFQVRVIESTSATSHRVTVKSSDLARFASANTDPILLVRRSFEFLLENEPKESILPRFDLSVIDRYFSFLPARDSPPSRGVLDPGLFPSASAARFNEGNGTFLRLRRNLLCTHKVSSRRTFRAGTFEDGTCCSGPGPQLRPRPGAGRFTRGSAVRPGFDGARRNASRRPGTRWRRLGPSRRP